MLAYILDHQTLKIKDLLEFEDYEFREDPLFLMSDDPKYTLTCHTAL